MENYNLAEWMFDGWKKELGTKWQFDKAVALQEQGDDEYKKENSNCCDAKIMMGICMECKEHTVSQYEAGE